MLCWSLPAISFYSEGNLNCYFDLKKKCCMRQKFSLVSTHRQTNVLKIMFIQRRNSAGGMKSSKCCSLSLLLFFFYLLSSLFFIESLKERSKETLPDFPLARRRFGRDWSYSRGKGPADPGSEVGFKS